MGWFTTVLEVVSVLAILAGIVGLAFLFWPAAAVVAGVCGLLVSRELARKGAA